MPTRGRVAPRLGRAPKLGRQIAVYPHNNDDFSKEYIAMAEALRLMKQKKTARITSHGLQHEKNY